MFKWLKMFSVVNKNLCVELRTIEEVSEENWDVFSSVFNQPCSCCSQSRNSRFLVSLKKDQKFTNLSSSCLDNVVKRMENTSLHQTNARVYKNLKSCYLLSKFSEKTLDAKYEGTFDYLVTIGKILEVEVQLYQQISKHKTRRTKSDTKYLHDINSIIFKAFNARSYSVSHDQPQTNIHVNIGNVTINYLSEPTYQFPFEPEQNPEFWNSIAMPQQIALNEIPTYQFPFVSTVDSDIWKPLPFPNTQALSNSAPVNAQPPQNLMSNYNVTHFDPTLLHLPLAPLPLKGDSSLYSSISSSFGNKTGSTEFAPASWSPQGSNWG